MLETIVFNTLFIYVTVYYWGTKEAIQCYNLIFFLYSKFVAVLMAKIIIWNNMGKKCMDLILICILPVSSEIVPHSGHLVDHLGI